MTKKPFRIRKIAIQKLFGRYNHEVDLKLNDRVTILHGPNGVGKTALLRLISAVFSGRFSDISRVTFKQLRIDFTDDTALLVECSERTANRRGERLRDLIVTLHSGARSIAKSEINLSSPGLNEWVRRFAMEIGTLRPLEDDLWLDLRTTETLTAAEVWSRYGSSARHRRRSPIVEDDWFAELRQRIGVHLIESQRLLRESRDPNELARAYGANSRMVPTVSEYARELQNKINETMASYATESQTLDQSFPQRLLKGAGRRLPVDELKGRMAEINEERARLQRIGLLDETATPPFDVGELDTIDPAQHSVMTLYVEDTARKLGVFDNLAGRIGLLLGTINKQKFRHKTVRIDPKNGFVVVGDDGRHIELESLSSGEQHELVLLYDLLFRVKPNTLVLIDEPELSLHVLWQKRFLPDLLEIVKAADFDAVLATHSPFMVGDRSDLMVDLDAGPEEVSESMP